MNDSKIPTQFTVASGARFGGISPQTFKRRVAALSIKPVAMVGFGTSEQPVYGAADTMRAILPYVSELEKARRVLPFIREEDIEQFVNDDGAVSPEAVPTPETAGPVPAQS